ncbi:MAG: hypothetical protein IIY77_05965, partial [Lachnospiraceae bacterium]|nr:hypothetical protein [Lachnospiraceae bacterium]
PDHLPGDAAPSRETDQILVQKLIRELSFVVGIGIEYRLVIIAGYRFLLLFQLAFRGRRFFPDRFLFNADVPEILIRESRSQPDGFYGRTQSRLVVLPSSIPTKFTERP